MKKCIVLIFVVMISNTVMANAKCELTHEQKLVLSITGVNECFPQLPTVVNVQDIKKSPGFVYALFKLTNF